MGWTTLFLFFLESDKFVQGPTLRGVNRSKLCQTWRRIIQNREGAYNSKGLFRDAWSHMGAIVIDGRNLQILSIERRLSCLLCFKGICRCGGGWFWLDLKLPRRLKFLWTESYRGANEANEASSHGYVNECDRIFGGIPLPGLHLRPFCKFQFAPDIGKWQQGKRSSAIFCNLWKILIKVNWAAILVI